METSIVISRTVRGKHCWPEAHEGRAYLRKLHMHDFRFVAHVVVLHDDRDIEFHDLGDEIVRQVRLLGYEQVREGMWLDFGRKSCEQLARELMDALGDRCWKVEVHEDPDNGAYVVDRDRLRNALGYDLMNPEEFE